MKGEAYLKGVIYKKSEENVKIVEYECVTWVLDLWIVAAIIECTIKEICYVSKTVKLYLSTVWRRMKEAKVQLHRFLASAPNSSEP